MGVIKVFISDIDGCLAEPYQPYDLPAWQTLATYTEQAEREHHRTAYAVYPRVSLCSGRAYPYVEAVTQALNIRMPVLFESGGGMFILPEAKIIWNPYFSPEIEQDLRKVADWLVRTCTPGTSLSFDYGKRTQAGIIGPDPLEIQRCVPRVTQYVAEHYPRLRVFHTSVSIDVLPAQITKVQALHWLAEVTGVALREMAYIGDTNGDIEALQSVGLSFAPANATTSVKAVVDVVTRGTVIEGVLEAYQYVVRHNQQALSGYELLS